MYSAISSSFCSYTLSNTHYVSEKGDTMPNASYVDDGTYVIVTCNEGYGIYGDKEIYCEGGKWSGLITPQCRPSRGS